MSRVPLGLLTGRGSARQTWRVARDRKLIVRNGPDSIWGCLRGVAAIKTQMRLRDVMSCSRTPAHLGRSVLMLLARVNLLRRPSVKLEEPRWSGRSSLPSQPVVPNLEGFSQICEEGEIKTACVVCQSSSGSLIGGNRNHVVAVWCWSLFKYWSPFVHL